MKSLSRKQELNGLKRGRLAGTRKQIATRNQEINRNIKIFW